MPAHSPCILYILCDAQQICDCYIAYCVQTNALMSIYVYTKETIYLCSSKCTFDHLKWSWFHHGLYIPAVQDKYVNPRSQHLRQSSSRFSPLSSRCIPGTETSFKITPGDRLPGCRQEGGGERRRGRTKCEAFSLHLLMLTLSYLFICDRCCNIFRLFFSEELCGR